MRTAEALTGTQKVAIVLMQLNRERAVAVMQQFTEAEAEEVSSEIMRMRRVDPDVAAEVIGEFYNMAVSGKPAMRGGRDFAAGLLEASFGSEKAAGLMNRVTSSMAGKSFEFLDDAEPNQVIALLDGELPQTIALVLAHLKTKKASAVMSGLPVAVRTDVAQAIAVMGAATPEAIGIVSEILKSRAGAVMSDREQTEVVGGVQPLVDIINRSDASTERALLEALDERDPELAEEIRSRMLTFADLVKLERRDVQQVLRGVDPAMLALAMKGASEAVTDVIRTNVSERNREILDSEIAAVGPVRASQVEEARADIVRQIREMESAGIITVRRNEDDDLVY
ncbi:flagellar motor switch protein FliG [Paenarthrobacter sp. DKR-5]|uniref:flagellar motor switch protein FliG n=1 Tax=Paenarthrobacter sp. DKR-5 TaxID=2835535 RepID=UPI001BDD4293|nr:flagellar motor switch protein FliG [Paenarthrobacter sp. DKR-5]MBT1002798.1 flagellar motor switch protein FliG [Paenarthrobacter sp. DKR-5]